MKTSLLYGLEAPATTTDGGPTDEVIGTFYFPEDGSGNLTLVAYNSSGTQKTVGLGALTGIQTVTLDDTDDGVSDALKLVHSSSDSQATALDGVGITFHLENATGTATVEEWASIDVLSTTITNGSEDGDIKFNVMANGVVTQALLVDSSDQSLTVGANATDADGFHQVRIYPVTASRGSLVVSATANSSADYAMTLTNAAALGQATTVTIPDPGAAAAYVPLVNSAHKVTITATADRTVTIGGNLSFGGAVTTTGAVSTGTVTLAGALTTAAAVTFTGAYAASFTIPDASTWAFPAGGGTLALASGAETGTTSATFEVDNDSAAAKIGLDTNSATGDFTAWISPANLTADRRLTIADANGTVMVLDNGSSQTAAGDFVITGTVDLRGIVTSSSGNPAWDLSGSSGAFKSTTGTNTLGGNVVLPANVTFDMSASSGTFKTGTGAVTINGDMATATGKDITIGGAGTFTSGTGAVALNGDVTIATGKDLVFTAGAGYLEMNGSVSGGIKLAPTATGTALTTIVNANCAAATITLPNATATLATVGLAETFSAAKTFSTAPLVTLDDTTDGIVTALTLTHSSSDNNATSFDGVAISFQLENATGTSTVEEWASMDVLSTTIANGTEDADIVFSQMLAGTVTPSLTLDASAQEVVIGQDATDANGMHGLRIWPLTAARGSILIQPTDNTGDDTVTITNGNTGGDITVTLPTSTGILATTNVAETFSAVKTFSVQPIVSIDDAATNTVTDCLRLSHSSTGTPAAGLGVGVSFYVEDLGLAAAEQASMDVVMATATDGAEDADIIFKTALNGAVSQVLKVDSVNQTVVVGQNVSDADGIQSVTVYPVTTAKGSIVLKAVANNAADVQTIIQNGQSGATSTFTLPTAASGYFALTSSAAGAIGRADLTEDALARYQIPLHSCRSNTGLVLDATGGDTLFKIVNGGYAAGTLTLAGEDAENETELTTLCFEFCLPPEYVADADAKVIVNAKYVNTGTATATTKTVDVIAWEVGDDGTAAAILASSPQTITESFVDYTFTLTDTNLTAGDRILVYVQTNCVEGGAGGGKFITAHIGSIEVQLDIKG